MIKNSSNEFKAKFLLEFTKQLIINSAPTEIFQLKEIVENAEKELPKKDEVKEKVKEALNIEEMEKSVLERQPEPQFLQKKMELPKTTPMMRPPVRRGVLKIPETQLPANFRYLRPSPTQKEVDLGKLNPLIKDPRVKIIECNGPEENIIVRGGMGTKPTGITLTQDEIKNTIEIFSKESKIPAHEGVTKVVLGNLIMSAIISDIVGSKFIIRKMAPGFRR